MKTPVTVEIHGSDLPGLSCGPDLDGKPCENVHVGLKHRSGPVELVPGDADSARWRFEVVVDRDEDGELDYGGPFVVGRRGERALGLVWGSLRFDDELDVFRAAKLRLEDLDPALVERAVATGGRLVCSLGLTDERGYPICASVRPPLLSWSVADDG